MLAPSKPTLVPSPTPARGAGRWERRLKRGILILGALTALFVSMVPPVEAGCRYKAFLQNGAPFASTHGELAVNTGVLASELLLVGSAVALAWLILDAFGGRR